MAHSVLLIALIIVIIVAFSISTVSSSFKFRKSKIIALFQDEPDAPANIHHFLTNIPVIGYLNHLIIQQS